MSEFAGKSALIFGGTSGIGLATARAFAQVGARVIVAARRKATGQEAADVLAREGLACRFEPADVSIEVDVAGLVDAVLDRHGRLDIVVNTAGVNPHALLSDSTTEDYERIFATNVRGTFLCLKHALRAMQGRGGGAIVNVGSIAGERVLPVHALYCASKSAASMLVRSAALESAPWGVRVNELVPGTVDTPMLRETWARDGRSDDAPVAARIPLGRLGRPEEAAAAILFLCSAQAAYVTGSKLTLDGGLVLAL